MLFEHQYFIKLLTKSILINEMIHIQKFFRGFMNFKKSLILFGAILALFSLPLRAAEQSESLDTPELRIEFLQSEIVRWTQILATLEASEENKDSLIAEAKTKIDAFKAHKSSFEALQAEYARLEYEAIALWANCNPDNSDEIIKQIKLNDDSKIRWLRRVSEICEAHDAIMDIGGQKNVNAPFFLKDITFLGTSNLLQLDVLGKNNFISAPASLRYITGRESDAASTILQLRVANQSRENGGGASCGYQALKNSIILSQAALCQTEDQPKILSNLLGVQLTRLLFGHVYSPWRAQVIINRKKYLIGQFIRNILLWSLACSNRRVIGNKTLHVDAQNASVKPVEHEFYVSVNCFPEGQWMVFAPYNDEWLADGYHPNVMFGYLSLMRDSQDVIKILVDELDIQAEQTAPQEISGSRLITMIIAKIKRKENPLLKQSPSDAAIGQHEPYEINCTELANIELIKKYFTGIENMKILINNGIRDLTTKIQFNQGALEEYIVNGRFGNGNVGLPGEWAAQEEIGSILRTEIAQGLLQIPSALGANIVTFFAGDGNHSFAGTLRFSDGMGGFIDDGDFVNIKNILADETSHAVIPIILRLPGHWITLVINKVGKNKQYMIADSLNSTRVSSHNVRELIALLEGLQEPAFIPDAEPSSSSSSTIRKPAKKGSADKNASSGYGCTIS